MALAASKPTWIDNQLGQSFFDYQAGEFVITRTEARSVGAQSKSPFVTNPPSQTSPADNQPKQLGQSLEVTKVISPHLEPTVPRSIEGVVSEIKRDTVKLICVSPNGDVEMQLPPTLIPNALMQVGQPVAISLDTTDGYRRPVIRARAIGAQPKLPGQEEFGKWVETL